MICRCGEARRVSPAGIRAFRPGGIHDDSSRHTCGSLRQRWACGPGGPLRPGQEQAYGRQWARHAYNSQDWDRFYHYPYLWYPQNFWNADYYRSSESLYYRYPPEMRVPVYNKRWHNEFPMTRKYTRAITSFSISSNRSSGRRDRTALARRRRFTARRRDRAVRGQLLAELIRN